ncbi:hypothetical protein B0H14DRAFT_3725153 [Mycena olivaceomarginata]|nr:hypothetical protein B0H14DRAFT_3726241 [Mycena olivaceomarginata]KAJ7887349.1 hypothetical protein B0H14DRAFT_3725153 [Mycena olivaceomarginata]
MPPKPTYNENIRLLNGDTDGSLDVPMHYDDWVFEIRDKQGNRAELPRFSDEYVGPIPGLKKNKAPAQDTPTDSEGFLLRFAINQLELSNKQADINNRASEALFESGIRAVQRGRGRGRHSRRFQNHRATDTYYGTAWMTPAAIARALPSARGRSASAEERSVRPRRENDEHAARGRSRSRTMAHDSTRPHSPYCRPSSRSMERVAARSRERLDRELREFRIWRVAENDKARFERDLADAKAKSLSQTAQAGVEARGKPARTQATSSQQKIIVIEEDVEMPAAPAIVTPAEGTVGKGKAKGPSNGTGPTSSAVASTSSAISSTSNGVNSTPNTANDIEDLLIDMYMDPANIALPEDNFGDFDELDFEGEAGGNLGL